jgi:seryl-tRNA synthetase
MHDLRMVREHHDALREAMRRRNMLDTTGPLIDRAVQLDEERRAVLRVVEEKKAQRNSISAEVAKRKRAGEDASELVERGRALGDEIASLEKGLTESEQQLTTIMLQIPNATLDDVPAGGEENNTVVRSWGTPRAAESVKPHWEIGSEQGVLDLERGAKVSGSGFIVYRKDGARLVRALMNLMLDLHTGEHGYEETWVPVIVNRASLIGTAQLPKFEEDQYGLLDEGMFLIPTAEVPVTNLYRDEIISEAELPKAFVAYSPCFRREAGAHGKDTRGLLRVHEFDKVELVRYCTPETSSNEHELITSHAERVLQLLELPYRVVLLAAGDTGFASAKTYDLEVFAPGVGKWLEVSSSSVFTDFQGRRANIRYRPTEGGKPRFVHTLNASGLAFPRIIASILEHHQNEDGTVSIPTALQPYFGSATLGRSLSEARTG